MATLLVTDVRARRRPLLCVLPILALYTLACAGGSAPAPVTPPSVPTSASLAPPAPPVAVPAPAPAPTVPSNEAVLKAGLCTTTVVAVTPIPLTSGRTVLQVQCSADTYNFAWASPLAPVLVVDGGPVSVRGVPTVDPAGTLSWVEPSPGGCRGGRYRFKGDQLVLEQQGQQACGAAVRAVSGPCAASEKVYFSCASRAKYIAVCGSGDAIQYRFGPRAAPELAYPTTPDARSFKVEERRTAQALANVLSFSNDGVRYEVTQSEGSGAGPSAESNNFVGVYVLREDKVIATVRCTGDVQADWSGLGAVVGR